MLVVISPAKRLDWTERDVATTAPAMQDDAVRLAKTARNLTLGKLKALMDLSDDLARLNRDRFQVFDAAPEAKATRPAVFAFAGDTYRGLDAETLGPDDIAYADDHLRILSGLYGLLRPRDAIQPYRLEMGSRLKTRRGASLYDYWRDDIAKALNTAADAQGTGLLLNCASQEYFGAVAPKALKLQVITPKFLEEKNGTAKMVSFFAKRARGAMARWVVQNRAKTAQDMRSFSTDGYTYAPDRSTETEPVFIRPYPSAAGGV